MDIIENAFSPKKCETTKNGLAFEVILDNPKSSLTPAKLTPHNTPNRQITNEDIRTKLQKAEERRQVFYLFYFFVGLLLLI
jgi:hypothetical protein